MTDDPNSLRAGEVAFALPIEADAGVYFIGTTQMPRRLRGECPKR